MKGIIMKTIQKSANDLHNTKHCLAFHASVIDILHYFNCRNFLVICFINIVTGNSGNITFLSIYSIFKQLQLCNKRSHTKCWRIAWIIYLHSSKMLWQYLFRQSMFLLKWKCSGVNGNVKTLWSTFCVLRQNPQFVKIYIIGCYHIEV